MATSRGNPSLQSPWARECTGEIPAGDVRLNVMRSHPANQVEKILWGEDMKSLVAAAKAANK